MQKSLVVVLVRLFVFFVGLTQVLPAALTILRDARIMGVRPEQEMYFVCWVFVLPCILIALWRYPASLLPKDADAEMPVSGEEAAYRVMGVYFIFTAIQALLPAIPGDWLGIMHHTFSMTALFRLVAGLILTIGAKDLRRMLQRQQARD